MSKPPIPKHKQKEIAKERIKTLFEQAAETFSKNKTLTKRYVTLARKICMKMRMRMPQEVKRKYCKSCNNYLKSGVNARSRIREGKVILTCLDCGYITRISLSKRSPKKVKENKEK